MVLMLVLDRVITSAKLTIIYDKNKRNGKKPLLPFLFYRKCNKNAKYVVAFTTYKVKLRTFFSRPTEQNARFRVHSHDIHRSKYWQFAALLSHPLSIYYSAGKITNNNSNEQKEGDKSSMKFQKTKKVEEKVKALPLPLPLPKNGNTDFLEVPFIVLTTFIN